MIGFVGYSFKMAFGDKFLKLPESRVSLSLLVMEEDDSLGPTAKP